MANGGWRGLLNGHSNKLLAGLIVTLWSVVVALGGRLWGESALDAHAAMPSHPLEAAARQADGRVIATELREIRRRLTSIEDAVAGR